ncbi:type 1 fimbrial protein [Serratia nevei]|uniref:fimbrial protein n=1 Tax=Serratia nevei TaxID=2703794 RepID=UPI0020A22606|nr:fimbrial protein [Serratia nevei]MCP1107098.1 type 1 fimbrial protein [Serratia nevei]
MKKLTIALVHLGAILLAPQLYAAEGVINATGKIKEGTCSLNSDAKNLLVDLGTSAAGSKTERDFRFTLTGCPPSLTQARFLFEGTAVSPTGRDIDKNVFAATNASEPGAAQNAGFLIHYRQGNSTMVVTPNKQTEAFILDPSRDVNTLYFSAMTESWGLNEAENSGYGTVSADIQFSLIYP